jgi:hypothetical protein
LLIDALAGSPNLKAQLAAFLRRHAAQRRLVTAEPVHPPHAFRAHTIAFLRGSTAWWTPAGTRAALWVSVSRCRRQEGS